LRPAAIVTLDQLREEPYASVVCYPRGGKVELRRRLEEMRKLGVSGLIFAGEKQVFGLPVLGKGCVGIVVIARVDGKDVALKIRRTDADRARMQREAHLLAKANAVCVGPQLLRVSRNFLLMQLIDGSLLPHWIENKPSKLKVMKVVRSILEQCYRLDETGLDHGELSHAPKHVIIARRDKPFIVDFETASLGRRPSNVTSMCQFLFLSSQVGTQIAEQLGMMDQEAVLDALRRYKSDRSCGNFEDVMLACGL
jgi:putative serine/threonine protein kinase